MNELNFQPATGGGFAADRSVPVPALDTGASSGRELRPLRPQRRRLNVLRFRDDSGFRLFRVF